MRKVIWSAEEVVSSRDIVVVVAVIDQWGVTVSEETGTSSQQVTCNTDRMKEVLNVRTDAELMDELERRFGSPCGYYNARMFMEENGIEFHWWGGSC